MLLIRRSKGHGLLRVELSDTMMPSAVGPPHPTLSEGGKTAGRNGKPRGGLFVVCILLEWITRSINRKACPNGVPGDGPFTADAAKNF